MENFQNFQHEPTEFSEKQGFKHAESTQYAVSYMQDIRPFFTSEQNIYNSLNNDLVSKYLLVVFAFSFIHNFQIEHDYFVNLSQL